MGALNIGTIPHRRHEYGHMRVIHCNYRSGGLISISIYPETNGELVGNLPYSFENVVSQGSFIALGKARIKKGETKRRSRGRVSKYKFILYPIQIVLEQKPFKHDNRMPD